MTFILKNDLNVPSKSIRLQVEHKVAELITGIESKKT